MADEFEPDLLCVSVEGGTAGAVLIGSVEAIVNAAPPSIMLLSTKMLLCMCVQEDLGHEYAYAETGLMRERCRPTEMSLVRSMLFPLSSLHVSAFQKPTICLRGASAFETNAAVTGELTRFVQ